MVPTRKRVSTILSPKTIQKPQKNNKTKKTNNDSSHTNDMAISSTPLLHLLKPSIEAILFPNYYTSKRNKNVFTTIQKLERMNDKINKIQTKQIQLNADNFETQLAVTELMSLVHAYTSSGKDGIPSAI